MQERAARLTQRIAGVPDTAALEQRIADRLSAGQVAIDPLATVQAARMVRDGLDTAKKIAQGDVSASQLPDGAMANVEAVVQVSERPAWFVKNNSPVLVPGDRESEFWIVHATAQIACMKQACSGVACIFREQDGVREAVGTGWLVAPHTLVTNAHVAALLAWNKPSAGWQLRPGASGTAEFGFEHAGARGPRMKLAQVLHVEGSGVPDIATFRVEALDAEGPAPVLSLDLAAQRAAGWNDTMVFAVGHPAADLNNDPNVAIVFGALDATKRVSPGRLTGVLGGEVLAHDCSTTNGSSGSPLIDFASYRVVGLHYFGDPGERNEAVFLAAIAQHPALAGSLSQACNG